MKKLILLLLFIPLVSFGQETYKNKLKFNPEINLIKEQIVVINYTFSQTKYNNYLNLISC